MRMLRKSLEARFNPTPLPDDIDSLIDIDSVNETDPQDVGLSQAGVDAIWHDTLRLFRTGMHPLLSLCIRRGGKIVLNRSLGYQRGDAHSDDPVIARVNTSVCLFSASKSVSAMLVHLLE